MNPDAEFCYMADEAHELVEQDSKVGPPVTTELNEWLASWTNTKLPCDKEECVEARYHVNCLVWAIARKAHQLLFEDKLMRVNVFGGHTLRNAYICVKTIPQRERLYKRVSFPRFTATPLLEPNPPEVLPVFHSSPETDIKAELDSWLQDCKGKQFPTRGESHDLAHNDITYVRKVVALRGYGLFLSGKHVSLNAGGNACSSKNSEICPYFYGNKDSARATISFPFLRTKLLPPPDPPE